VGDSSEQRVRLSAGETLGLIWSYARAKTAEQSRSVALIVVYLVVFQVAVLRVGFEHAWLLALGIALVVGGLALFIEGLVVGLMPLSEVIGLRLPQRAPVPAILLFAFALGVTATLAEPAIGILRIAGSSVKAWEAPLLFYLLSTRTEHLVGAVAAGVGLAVVLGMLRFLRGWSLKPLLYVSVPLALGLTIWASFDPNVVRLVGVAWDCGGVTTGPVTVPLVLALGIGVCRIVGTQDSAGAGLGIVTLASLLPIATVLALGLAYAGQVPQPMSEAAFCAPENRQQVSVLFSSPGKLAEYVRMHASPAGRQAFAGAGGAGAAADRADEAAVAATAQAFARRHALGALRAVVPLSLILLVVLALLRQRLPRGDEVFFGITIAVVGMMLLTMGIELGLARLGGVVGSRLPSSFREVPVPQEREVIREFDTTVVNRAVGRDGRVEQFFYVAKGRRYETRPYDPANYDPASQTYTYTPVRQPLFGAGHGAAGVIVLLLFAFVLGYGATLAEPALYALGVKIEEISVGTMRRGFLIQAVAVGVGVGMVFGVLRVTQDIPLVWLLLPPYVLLLLLSAMSREQFVNIAWDSAGVTTGPVTVPLVLAMGLGISGEMGVVEGFGILAMASVFPILSVLVATRALVHSQRRSLRA